MPAPLRLFAALVPVVLCSGCIGLSGTTSSQPQSLGPVTLSISACVTGSPGCAATPNSGQSFYSLLGPGDVVPMQLLFAVRLPDGAVPPDVLSATLGAGPGLLTLNRSAGYEAELNELEPAPAGERWWGWLSAVVDYATSSPQTIALSFPLGLPRPADGGPLPSPMSWRPVVGGRLVDVPSGLPATRPVDCGPDLYDSYNEQNPNDLSGTTTCIDSPVPNAVRAHLGAPITDFGIVGTAVQAPAGSIVTATFLAKRSGPPDPSTTFALAPSGGPPGGSVTIDRTTAPLGGDATVPVLATVTIPPGTPPGDYPLTLTGTAAGKPTRSGVATVSVPAPAPPPPGGGTTADTTPPAIASASLSRTRFRAGAAPTALSARAKAGTTLRVSVSEAATLAIAVDRLLGGRRAKGRCSRKARTGRRCTIARRAGSLTRALPQGPSAIAFSGRLGTRKLKPGRYRLSLLATDAAGNRSGQTRLRFRLVRR